MKHIYSCLRPQIDYQSYAEWITKSYQKSSISCRGLIAFTSSFCLNQRRPNSCSYHVYVADINTPNKPYLVTDSDYEFTLIEWDPCGAQLLVCDVRGCVYIFKSNECLISDWQLVFKQNFAAEIFITASWYHPGFVTKINVANQNLKSPSNHIEYSEKIQRKKFCASLRLFGGKAAEGCLLISRTGLLCCLTRLKEFGNFEVICDSLGPLRRKVMVADICYDEDGSFLVGTSTGPINSTITFFSIYLTAKNLTLNDVDTNQLTENRRITISCKPYASFHLNVLSQILSETENSLSAFERIGQIKFVTKESPNDILVEVQGQNLSLIELWELEPAKKQPIHSVILDTLNSQTDVKPSIGPNDEKTGEQDVDNNNPARKTSKCWVFKGNYIAEKELVAIQTPRFKLFSTNRHMNLILLAYKDHSVCCLRREDLTPLFEPFDLSDFLNYREVKRARVAESENIMHQKGLQYTGNGIGLNKQTSQAGKMNKRKLVQITDIQLSANNATLFVIDSLSQIHVIGLPPLLTCQDDQDFEVYLQYLLEYCLVTGNDWWDVMMCAKHESIESICDRVHDSFERQPTHVHVNYSNRQLTIRASLYRCINDVPSLCRAADCHAMIILNYIASSLKSLLRSQDQDSATDNLANILKSQENQEILFNCNDVISRLNERDFQVETNVAQCLQPLIQWVTELAIFLIVSRPQQVKNKSTRLPGAGLAEHRDALETIRELLVIIKIWSQQNDASAPTIIRLNDQIDVLCVIFRLISTMYQSLGREPDESLLDGCARLGNNISVPQFTLTLKPVGVVSMISQRNLKNSSIVFEYFKESGNFDLVELPQLEGAISMNGNRRIDVVRNISLGTHPISNLRQCTRCQSVSLVKPTFNSIRTWEQRWIRQCVCGGSWAQSGNTFESKLSHLAWAYHSSMGHQYQLVR